VSGSVSRDAARHPDSVSARGHDASVRQGTSRRAIKMEQEALWVIAIATVRNVV